LSKTEERHQQNLRNSRPLALLPTITRAKAAVQRRARKPKSKKFRMENEETSDTSNKAGVVGEIEILLDNFKEVEDT
jgi:hypothetical protein